MFIKRLYSHSRLATIAFLLFIVAFIYINYKWGVVATPIYQLGMYSHVAHRTDTQSVYTFYVNDKPLALGHLPIAHADMIRVSFSHYENHRAHNKSVLDMFSNYSERLLNKLLPPASFTNNITDKQAGQWFQYLLQRYKIPMKNLSVYSNKYLWIEGALRPIGREELKYMFAADL